MAVFRKTLALLVVTGAALALMIWTYTSFEFRSPTFAFLTNWLIMSWVAIMGQFVVFPLFPSTYYEIKSFEQSGQVYERLGITLFKKMVRRGPLSVFSPTLRFPENRTKSALKKLEDEMRKAETSHVVIFFIILFLIIYALIKGWLDAALWLLFFNVLFNAYAVMLQRYNRLKIDEFIDLGMAEPKQDEA